MRFSIALALPLALSVAALKVTEPAKGAEVDLSKSFTVKWDSVDTDANTVDIILVNNAIYPSVEEKIASDIDTSKGSYTASGLKDIAKGSGFQVNLMSTSEKNTGILAQSQQFNVTEPAESSSSATSTGTSSTVSSSTSASTSGVSTGSSTAGSSTTGSSSEMSTTVTSVATLTGTAGTATGTTTGTFTKTGLATSASASGSASGSSTAAPTPSTGAAMSLIAQPIALAGAVVGALALNL